MSNTLTDYYKNIFNELSIVDTSLPIDSKHEIIYQQELVESFNNNYSTIYAIGDLHGDIMPLIICLRDCCKVIKKKTNFYFTQTEKDTDLVNELNKEYTDDTYKDDLNYEWIGQDCAIVLCGDLLDNVRNDIDKKPEEYPFEEAKILKFINAINKQAMERKGRIFKILGNHDMYNLNGKVKTSYKNYVSNYAKNYEGYKQGANSRLDYFGKGKPGAKLLGQDNAYVFLMINDIIFVHGGISSKKLNSKTIISANNALNRYINDENETTFDYRNDTEENELTLSPNHDHEILKTEKDGLTVDRFFGFKSHIPEKDMCEFLYKKFRSLCNDMIENNIKCNPEKMKLVIGHCNQNVYTSDRTYRTSFAHEIFKNEFIEEYGGYVNAKGSDHGIYGITVSCGININKPSIFRVDVGMSRGFNLSDYDEKHIFSRTPQVLKIVYTDNFSEPKITIIKSSLKNTLIHLHDNYINPYKNKYLKYKNKYLKLKENLFVSKK
jgi:hypothetical protein